MICTVVLFVLLIIASYTDITQGKIFNTVVYPGIVMGPVAGLTVWMLDLESRMGAERYQAIVGFVDVKTSGYGLIACGGVMVICYAFFAGQIGGGDVKLIAMLGSLLGPYLGLEAMLWTFVLGGVMAVVQLIWMTGVTNLAVQCFRYVVVVLRSRSFVRLTQEEREPLKTNLFLAPSALIATVIVRFDLVHQML